MEMIENKRNGSITAGLTTGIIGTALGVMNGAGGLLGLANNQNSTYVTKDTLDMAMQLAAKDSKIALLEAVQESEVKMADIYQRLSARIREDEQKQEAINAQQAVYNGVNSSALGTLRAQVDQIVKIGVPNSAVIPGWGEVTVTPA